MSMYKKLYAHFGPRHWWPAKSAFEVMVGAILTQNTAWSNVEKAIANLRREGLLSQKKISQIKTRKLAALIRPSGFYNEKAKKLKELVRFLAGFCGSNLRKLRQHDTAYLRKEFLRVHGIGPETADSILLYALGKASFVVDAYTKRICMRHKLIPEHATYHQIQEFFTDNLLKDAKIFNEYHALIVETGKNYCKKNKPLCKICPLRLVKCGKNMVYLNKK